MSGRLDDLSPKQEALLAEFKLSMSDVLEPKHDDHLLLQFLRARCFDLKKAEDMFRKHLEWRKEFKEDFFVNFKIPEVLEKYLLPPLLGFDKEGSPVRFINLGQTDFRGITSSVKLQDLKNFAVWCLDHDKHVTKLHNAKFGRHVESRVFIFDLKGLSLRQVTPKAVLEMVVAYLKLYEANYPENLKVCYVLNIPYFFAWIFNIVKSILSADTIKKMRIHGKDGWKEDLIDAIDPDILPVAYGGTRTDPNGDPNCSSLFPLQGTIPTSYYLKNQRNLNKEDDNVEHVVVGRRGKYEVELVAETSGCSILWEVECPNHDVNLGIFYEPKSKGENGRRLEEVIPPTKICSETGPASGTYVVKKAGKYVLVLDNSYSLIRSKSVLYKVTVVPSVSTFVNESDRINPAL